MKRALLRLSGIYVLYVIFRLWIDGEEDDGLEPWPLHDERSGPPYNHPDRVGLGSM